MIKLTIQNGHRNPPNGQTGTSGIASNGQKLNEVDFIDQTYYAIKALIDSDQNLNSKIQLSYDDATVNNGKTADYFVALHGDGSTDPNVRGGFIDDNPTDQVYHQSMAFAKEVADAYFPNVGIPYRNGQTPNSTYYYAFNETGSLTKQFLIECGTMSNKQDMDKMIDVKNVGKLILNGIINYFKLNEPIFQNSPPPSVDPRDQKIADLSKQVATLQNQLVTIQTETAKQLADKDAEVLKKLQDMKQKVVSFAQTL